MKKSIWKYYQEKVENHEKFKEYFNENKNIFVLHLNHDDINIVRASLRAMRTFANEILNYDKNLAEDIYNKLEEYDKKYEGK